MTGLRGAVSAMLLAGGALLAAPPASSLEIGDTVPVLSAPQLDGLELKLEALRGQVVYVDFWASWCAPCLQALPALDRLYRKHRKDGFTVLAVNVDTDRAAALKMLRRVGVSFPVVFDPQGVWPQVFALRGMPSGYLLDRRGVVRYVKTGYTTKDLPAIEEQVLRELERAK